MKTGVLFTITTFLLFLSLFALVEFTIQQKNQNIEFANKLSASNNVFYHFDSLEYGTRRIEAAYGPNMTVDYGTGFTNFTIREMLPTKYADDINKFYAFVKQMSFINITTGSVFGKYIVSPYNMSVENTNSGITNTFLDNNSAGKVKGIRLDIYANDTTSPIKSDDAEDPNGINLFIYMHTSHGQERTYNKTLDPDKQTNISLHIAYGPPQPPRQSHTADVTFGPGGALNITLEPGLEFYYVQSFILEDYGKVNINSFSSIIVNNTDYGVSKNSTVRVIV